MQFFDFSNLKRRKIWWSWCFNLDFILKFVFLRNCLWFAFIQIDLRYHPLPHFLRFENWSSFEMGMINVNRSTMNVEWLGIFLQPNVFLLVCQNVSQLKECLPKDYLKYIAFQMYFNSNQIILKKKLKL